MNQTKRYPPRMTPVTDASAWRANDVGQDPSWVYRFDDQAIAELDTALQAVRHQPVTEITRADFRLDKVARDLQRVRDQVEHGIGMVVLRGLPVRNYTKEDAARIYWGIGMHLGRPVTQNKRAHLLGHVKDEGVAYGHKTRGYNTKARLSFHTDNCDVVGLLCLRTARQGGLSRITSSMSIFNEILRRAPALLEPLFDGFVYDLKGEELPGRLPWSHKIPVFSECAGKLSCRYIRNAIMPGFVQTGTEPTALQVAAMDLFDELARSPDLCFEMAMEPGDMQMLNNHVVVHSRTEFEDYEEEDRKRHLLRLWLRTDVRPLESVFIDRFGPGTARMGVPTPEAMGMAGQAR